MVTNSVLVDVLENLFFTGEAFGGLKRFEDRARILFASSEVVDFCYARSFYKFPNESGDIFAVDIVTYLFPFVAKYLVFAGFEIAFDEVAQEPMDFDAGVVGTGEATTTQAAGRHVEIPAIFLDHDIGRELGCAK